MIHLEPMAQGREEYQRKYAGYCPQFEKIRNQMTEIEDIRLECTAKEVKIQMFMERLETYSDLVTEFDEAFWYSMVEYVTVFTFRDGTEVTVKKGSWEAA